MKVTQPFSLALNEQTPKVKELVDYQKDKDLIVAFAEYASSLPQCLGLAANQVMMNKERIMKRFFVIHFSEGLWMLVLNPQIVKYHGSPRLKTEGCKTWPGKPIVVYRYPKVEVRFQTLPLKEGEEQKTVQRELVALAAQVFQHEVDHLNGVEEKFTNHIQKDTIQRNEKCPCGSGLKYKNCCLNQDLK